MYFNVLNFTLSIELSTVQSNVFYKAHTILFILPVFYTFITFTVYLEHSPIIAVIQTLPRSLNDE